MDWRSAYRATLAFLILAAIAGALWLLVIPGAPPGVEISIPEAGRAPSGAGAAGLDAAGAPDAPEALININTATAEELTELPGIGEARAASIVEHREMNGPFERLDQLMAISGIGPKTYENLRPLTTVGE